MQVSQLQTSSNTHSLTLRHLDLCGSSTSQAWRARISEQPPATIAMASSKCFFFSHLASAGCKSPSALGKEWVHSQSGTRFFPGYKAVVTYRDPQRVGHSCDVVCEIFEQASTGRPVFVISMPSGEHGEAVRVSSHSATRCLKAFQLRVRGRDSSGRSGFAFFGLTRAAVQRDLRELDKEIAQANEGKWHFV